MIIDLLPDFIQTIQNVFKRKGKRWLAIDPKGVIGPRGYEVGPFLINPVPKFLNGSNPKAQTEKRLAILSETLSIEWERIRSWGFCHAVLSAWWSVEDKEDWRYAIHCAEIFQEVNVKRNSLRMRGCFLKQKGITCLEV